MALARVPGLLVTALGLSACLEVPAALDDDALEPAVLRRDVAASLDDALDEVAAEPGVVLVADGESTRRGTLVEGSYLDSQRLDGVTERIEAERGRDDDHLEHVWVFGPVPAGSASLSAVVRAHAATPEDTYAFEYKTSLERGHIELFLVEGQDDLVHYEGTFELATEATIELRAKLSRIRASDGAPRALDVDFLAITAAPAEASDAALASRAAP